MRDAIVISGWTWEANNVPERIAGALAYGGSRVLYCENPACWLRSTRRFSEVEKGIFAFGLRFVGHRLNSFPLARSLQAKLLAREILNRAESLRLKDPVFIYPHGEYCLPLCREFNHRGFPLIHICMDYELELLREHVRESDVTLAIPRRAYEELKEEFGDKVRLVPQFSNCSEIQSFAAPADYTEAPELSTIPRPRLGYLGDLTGRVSLSLLGTVLGRNPEWYFVSFGGRKHLPLANAHILAWRGRDDVARIVRGFDVGFMLYDCSVPKNLNCVPLKLFDYFACGIPVVSTPILFLREFRDLVYTGETAEEIVQATRQALTEPVESPRRAARIAVARQYSIVRSAQVLRSVMDELPAG